ncbi:cytochrome P450 [Lophiotrema nucula]|uniref:Cytochrome P450 n=1 Tax=Lophiotrema nucula TaxID=690887 RepID=A0A6A5YJ61_9PLEO|nr:cytochrome P450 [Lophiotrema nucula]
MSNLLTAAHPIAWIAAISLLVTVAILRARRYLLRYRFKKQHGCQAPQSAVWTKDILLGLDGMWESFQAIRNHHMLELFQRRFAERGDTWVAASLLRRKLFTIDPENLRSMLSTNVNDWFLDRDEATWRFIGPGVFTTDGAAWSHSRALLRPNFVQDKIAHLDMFERHFQNFLTHIPHDGATVDLQPLFFQFTIDAATEFLFGKSTSSLKPGADRTYYEANFDQAWATAADHCRWQIAAAPFKFREGAEVKRAVDLIHAYADKFVHQILKERRESEKTRRNGGSEKRDTSNGRYSFAQELAKSTDDALQIRHELLNIFAAGRDTTASMLSNMFVELAKRPDVWAKLQSEIAVLNGAPPTLEQMRSFRYVHYCMNESLRLWHVVPLNYRKAFRDTYLPRGGGSDGQSPIFMPKGTTVTYSSFAMHRRKAAFGEDADTFRPERWEGWNPSCAFQPFGIGQRICLGQKYALNEVGYLMIRILQEFKKIESRQPLPWTETSGLVLSSLHGTKVSLTPA